MSTYYVLDENNNKVEAFDKQGVLALLDQAIKDGSLENIVADAAFVSKLKCCVGGGTYQIAFITQAKYNELAANDALLENAYYFIVDDTTAEDLNEKLLKIDDLEVRLNNINENISNSRHYIDYSNFSNTDLIYDTAVDISTQNRVDLTSLLRKDKTVDDTIGISGCLKITLDAESETYLVNFNILWDAYDNNTGHLNLMFKNSSNNKLYLAPLELGIDVNNKLYILASSKDDLKAVSVTENSMIAISKIQPYYLNIFYK